MKKNQVFFAGALLAVAAFGQSGDPFAEERFRQKTGRYTPAEEARQNALRSTKVKNAATEAPSCCRYIKGSLGNESVDPASNEARFRIRYGRSTPAAEAREKAGVQEAALLVRKCVELGKCTLMRADRVETNTVRATAGDPGRAARFQAKIGRDLPGEEANVRPLLASRTPVACKHECCMKGL